MTLGLQRAIPMYKFRKFTPCDLKDKTEKSSSDVT